MEYTDLRGMSYDEFVAALDELEDIDDFQKALIQYYHDEVKEYLWSVNRKTHDGIYIEFDIIYTDKTVPKCYAYYDIVTYGHEDVTKSNFVIRYYADKEYMQYDNDVFSIEMELPYSDLLYKVNRDLTMDMVEAYGLSLLIENKYSYTEDENQEFIDSIRKMHDDAIRRFDIILHDIDMILRPAANVIALKDLREAYRISQLL